MNWRRLKLAGLGCILLIVIFSGCGLFTDNPHDTWVMVSERRERAMGERAAAQLEEHVGLYESDTYTEYLQGVGARLAIYSDRPELDFQFKILDTFLVNALALPGGYVYVSRGLLQELEDEAELASILGHEIGHVTAYHAVKRTQLALTTIITAVAAAGRTGGRSLPGGLIATDMMARGYTRTAEDEADELGMRYAAAAGYDPNGLIRSLEKLLELSNEIPDDELIILRTHPYLEDRIRTAELRVRAYYNQISDTPRVNRSRYQRYKRQYLFTDQELQLLSRLDNLVEAYQNQDVEELRKLLHDEFEVGKGDEARSQNEFLEEQVRKFEKVEKIDYEYRLVDMDVGDTDARVVYEYKEMHWFEEQQEPRLIRNYQEFIWRYEDETWKLMRLR